MFTGIITQIGTLKAIESSPEGARLQIAAQWADVPALGASIACNGICLTVVEADASTFTAEAMPETLRLTTLGGWKKGMRINLERALRAGDELGGHFVSGHVDGRATIASMKEGGNSTHITLEAPSPLHRYIAAKGSVTLDGISLTVTSAENNRFSVALIPHTRAVTIAGEWRKGTQVNLEIDPLARYAERLMETKV